MRRAFVVAAVLVLVLAAPAFASHGGQYARNPVEHDDQGRSDEPDFATTGVLGPALANRVLDLDLDGVATPDPQLPPPQGRVPQLAPGCTDDVGRQRSGLCGLQTVGVGVLEGGDVVPPGMIGVQPMSHQEPPGGYTPKRSTVVRFLDARIDAQVLLAGATRLDVNHKVADLHHPALLPPSFTGPTALWAWLGDWQDKNANGVLDHLGDAHGNMRSANEFVWRGGCLGYGGGPPNPGPHCAVDPAPAPLQAYLFPGEHTARCGVGPSTLGHPCAAPGDLPGSAAKCFLLAHAPLGDFGLCTPLEANEDPLLGPQDGVAPDGRYDDRTGDRDIAVRGWFFDLGWSTWFYDGSVLVSHVLVAAYGAPADPASPHHARLDQARFLDVDAHRALHPATDQVLQAQVKPAARGAFLLVRDVAVPFVEQAMANQARDLLLRVGPSEDAVLDPGWSHEPNTPQDRFPGARFRHHAPPSPEDPDAEHHGWLNDYAAHAAGPRPWVDVQSYRELHNARALDPFAFGSLTSCILCVTGPVLVTAASPEPMSGHAFPRGAGDHARALGPGIHHFEGHAGWWHDRPHVREVHYVDLLTLHHVREQVTVGPDTWVGDLLDLTGAPGGPAGLRTDRCTLGGVTADHPWGWCHPYLDGAVSDPNRYSELSKEWTGHCGTGGMLRRLVLEPEGGVWTVPVLVWRDTWITRPFRLAEQVEDFTGGAGPIELQAYCTTNGRVYGNDAVVLPDGNLGLRVTSRFEVQQGPERVVDVDVYEPWGA